MTVGQPAGGGSGGAAGPSVSGTAGAIAYPVYAGSPGIAPDHTIVVTGFGQAEMKSDGSDRAAAQKAALGTALADARAQADAIAAATNLSIVGVLSVSASVSPGYGVMPLVGNGTAVPSCVIPPVVGGTPSAGSLPQPACPPVYQPALSVSATVAYRVG